MIIYILTLVTMSFNYKTLEYEFTSTSAQMKSMEGCKKVSAIFKQFEDIKINTCVKVELK